jgi:hypothetical protein
MGHIVAAVFSAGLKILVGFVLMLSTLRDYAFTNRAALYIVIDESALEENQVKMLRRILE